jgi:hypothetical protein
VLPAKLPATGTPDAGTNNHRWSAGLRTVFRWRYDNVAGIVCQDWVLVLPAQVHDSKRASARQGSCLTLPA